MFQLPLLCWNYISRNSRKDVEDHQFYIKRTRIFMKQGQKFIFFRCYNIVNFVNMILFRWRNIFRVTIIFWGYIVKRFTKSSKSGVVFNNNELFWALFSSFHCIILLSVLVQQARELLLHDKELKGKILLQHSMQYQDLSQFWGYL